MPLEKQIVDIPVMTGLSQKFDARLAPDGVSIQAVNLVKNKRNTLQKRPGFTGLVAGSANQVGLNLGTHLEKLVSFTQQPFVGRGTNQLVNTINVYSDNVPGTQKQCLVPEVLAHPKEMAISLDALAYETDVATNGDYQILVWTSPVKPTTLVSAVRQLWYCVLEASTGNVLVPPSVIDSADCTHLSVFSVGQYVVVTYLNTTVMAGAFRVFGQVWNSTTPFAGFGSKSNIVSTSTTFDADSVAVDNGNFVIIYQGGTTDGPDVIKISRISVSPTLAVAATTIVNDVNIGVNIGIVSFGIYADTTTNQVAGCYTYNNINSPQTVGAAVAAPYPNIPANTIGNTIASVTTGGINHYPIPANTIGICSVGQILNNPTGVLTQSWIVTWGAPRTSLEGSTVSQYNTAASFVNQFPTSNYVTFFLNAGTPTVTASAVLPRQTFGCVPISRPTFINNVPYIITYVPSTIQGTYYLCAIDSFADLATTGYFPFRVVATMAPRQALLGTSGNNAVAAAIGTTNSLTHIPVCGSLPYSTRCSALMVTPVGQKNVPAIYEIEFASKRLYRNFMHGSSMAVASGVPSLYDGVQSVEISYCYYPEVTVSNITGALSAWPTNYNAALGPGPFSLLTDQVNYIFTYEWTDSQGQRHISARSPVVAITGQRIIDAGFGGGHTGNAINTPGQAVFNFKIPCQGLGYRVLPSGAIINAPESIISSGGTITIGVYRTALNQLDTYYRVADPLFISDSSSMAAGTNLFNDPSSSFLVTIVDNVNDAALISQPLLYGDGSNGVVGNIDNLNPPSSGIICTHKSRIFLADGNLVWFTKALTPTEAPAFNETSMLFSVGDTTPITGLASLDDKLIIFKRKSIYYIAGDGPSDSGVQNEFTPPQPVPTELGCTDFRSILTTPEGTYFYSDAGYRVLDRSLTVQYPGTAIEDELFTYPFITSACIHPSSNRMVLCVTQNDSAAPGAYVSEHIYRDYVLDAWTTAKIANGSSLTTTQVACGVGLAPRGAGEAPTLHILSADGSLYRENDTSSSTTNTIPYYDKLPSGAQAYVNWTLQMSWYKIAQAVAGFGRVWRVIPTLIRNDPSRIEVDINTEYDSSGGSLSNAARWNPTELTGNANVYRPVVYVKNQRCTAISTTMTETAPTDGSVAATGQGYSILSLTMEVGTYPGGTRRPGGDQK